MRVGACSSNARLELRNYPELEVVLSLAVATVAEVYGLHKSSSGVAVLEKAAILAMIDFYAPVVATAARLAATAEQARAARAATVERAVELKAAWANSIAAALQTRQERDAGAPDDVEPEVRVRRELAAKMVQESVQLIAAEEAAAAETAARAVHHDTRKAAAAVAPGARATCYHLALVAAIDAAAALTNNTIY